MGDDEWDLNLPQTIRFIHGRDPQLPDAWRGIEIDRPVSQGFPEHDYESLEVYVTLRTSKKIWSQDTQEPALFLVGDRVWLHSKMTSKHNSANLLLKFVGHVLILQVEDNNTYPIYRNGCVYQESENRLKAFYKSTMNLVQHQPTRQARVMRSKSGKRGPGILGMAFLAGQQCTPCLDKGVVVWRGDNIP